jgi:putative tryptophan/tyrosine transport system substrate-binding protein
MRARLAKRFVAVAVGLLAAAPAAQAQPEGKVWRVGVLSSLSRGTPPGTLALVDGLRELGHVEGRNLAIEWRGAEGQASRFPALAAQLVQLNVDVIVATVPPAIQAAQSATKTIPIVMVTPSDPIGAGFVRSFAHPGGNITGLTWQTREAVPKRLQLLKETVPTLGRVAVLWDATEPARRRQVEEAEAAAPTVGVQLQILEVRSLAELDGAFCDDDPRTCWRGAYRGELNAGGQPLPRCGSRRQVSFADDGLVRRHGRRRDSDVLQPQHQ